MKKYKVYIDSLWKVNGKHSEKTEKNLNELAKEGYGIVGVAPYGSYVNIYLKLTFLTKNNQHSSVFLSLLNIS